MRWSHVLKQRGQVHERGSIQSQGVTGNVAFVLPCPLTAITRSLVVPVPAGQPRGTSFSGRSSRQSASRNCRSRSCWARVGFALVRSRRSYAAFMRRARDDGSGVRCRARAAGGDTARSRVRVLPQGTGWPAARVAATGGPTLRRRQPASVFKCRSSRVATSMGFAYFIATQDEDATTSWGNKTWAGATLRGDPAHDFHHRQIQVRGFRAGTCYDPLDGGAFPSADGRRPIARPTDRDPRADVRILGRRGGRSLVVG